MRIFNHGVCIFAAAVLLTSCGKQERAEAERFHDALAAKQANAASADRIESEMVTNARAWCGAITAGGGGKGVELDQNASVAAELAKSAVAVSTELSAIRQAVDAETLTAEFPRNLRATLITQLTLRQRYLQDVRSVLEDSAAQFRAYAQSRAYNGDTYPEGMAKLAGMLGTYKPPEDAVGSAITALASKYNLPPRPPART